MDGPPVIPEGAPVEDSESLPVLAQQMETGTLEGRGRSPTKAVIRGQRGQCLARAKQGRFAVSLPVSSLSP